jgi:hypothetical protein
MCAQKEDLELIFLGFVTKLGAVLRQQEVNGAVRNLFNYFKENEIWYSDMTYAVLVSKKEEQQFITSCFESVLQTTEDEHLKLLYKQEWIDPILDLLKKENEEKRELHMHWYTRPDIPQIVNNVYENS